MSARAESDIREGVRGHTWERRRNIRRCFDVKVSTSPPRAAYPRMFRRHSMYVQCTMFRRQMFRRLGFSRGMAQDVSTSAKMCLERASAPPTATWKQFLKCFDVQTSKHQCTEMFRRERRNIFDVETNDVETIVKNGRRRNIPRRFDVSGFCGCFDVNTSKPLRQNIYRRRNIAATSKHPIKIWSTSKHFPTKWFDVN